MMWRVLVAMAVAAVVLSAAVASAALLAIDADDLTVFTYPVHIEVPTPTPTPPLAPPDECAGMTFDSIIIGSDAEDHLDGGNGRDLIFGLGSDDTVDGGNGADCIVGSEGNDVLTGSNGQDVLLGGPGNDTINGGNGADRLYGGDDTDILNGDNADDVIDGGGGNDACSGGRGPDTIVNCESVFDADSASEPSPDTPAPAALTFEYQIKPGDTLFDIALRFGTSVEALAEVNGLASAQVVWAGQVLKVPATAPPAPPSPPSPPAPPVATVEYTLRPGESVWDVAAFFGTTVETIAALNGLADASLVVAGQRLLVPEPAAGAGAAPPLFTSEYVVQPGDTLFDIALRFGTSVKALAAANRLANPSVIHYGDRLLVP